MSGSGPARELNRTRKVEAAYQNEYLIRQRVDRLEVRLETWIKGNVDGWRRDNEAILRRGFWGRLRWLLLGR